MTVSNVSQIFATLLAAWRDHPWGVPSSLACNTPSTITPARKYWPISFSIRLSRHLAGDATHEDVVLASVEESRQIHVDGKSVAAADDPLYLFGCSVSRASQTDVSVGSLDAVFNVLIHVLRGGGRPEPEHTAIGERGDRVFGR